MSRPRTVLVTMSTATGTGAGQAAHHFCEAMVRNGWHVVVACGPPPPVEGYGSIEAMSAVGIRVVVLDRAVAPTWPVWRQLQSLAREIQPAGVIGVMQRDRAVALALSRKLGVPGIIMAQNQHVFWGSFPVRTAKRLLYGFALRHWASLVVCTSPVVKREVEAFGVVAERAVVLPNGIVIQPPVEVSAAEQSAIRAELGAAPSELLLLNVGRLDVQKGQDILLDSFARVAAARPGLRLALIGDVSGGPNRDRMAEFAAELRQRVITQRIAGRVVFAGWRRDVARALRAADAYVHSARWEGFSFAVLEAMAACLPLVITDCSGRPDGFVDGQHGWMVPKGDASALARAIAAIADLTGDERRAMGERARQLVVSSYNIQSIAARFVELINRTLAATV